MKTAPATSVGRGIHKVLRTAVRRIYILCTRTYVRSSNGYVDKIYHVDSMSFCDFDLDDLTTNLGQENERRNNNEKGAEIQFDELS